MSTCQLTCLCAENKLYMLKICSVSKYALGAKKMPNMLTTCPVCSEHAPCARTCPVCSQHALCAHNMPRMLRTCPMYSQHALYAHNMLHVLTTCPMCSRHAPCAHNCCDSNAQNTLYTPNYL